MLSPTSSVSNPAIATISPLCASSISTLSSPSKPISFDIRPLTCSPLAFASKTLWFFCTVPLKILATPILPT